MYYIKDVLNIRDLVKILGVLKDGNFQTTKWFDLGLLLHLSYNDLTKIKIDYPDSNERLRECLALWLNSDTAATWDTLANAVSASGDQAAAAYISKINIKLIINWVILKTFIIYIYIYIYILRISYHT